MVHMIGGPARIPTLKFRMLVPLPVTRRIPFCQKCPSRHVDPLPHTVDSASLSKSSCCLLRLILQVELCRMAKPLCFPPKARTEVLAAAPNLARVHPVKSVHVHGVLHLGNQRRHRGL